MQDDAPLDGLRQAALRSLDALQRQPPDRELPALTRRVRVDAMATVLNAVVAAEDTPGAIATQLCGRFRLYRVMQSAPSGGDLLITGYYAPEIRASRVETEHFRYPLYRTPNDLVDVDLDQFCSACAGRVAQGRVVDGNLVPYYSRGEIDAGVLAGKDYEIAWLDDPVEAFFLHVQGSARLRFDDGVVMDISYSSSNGRQYTSIGRVLIDQGKMAPGTVSLQTLKQYLHNHPDEQASLMAANQRYIFFRAVAVGPIGSLGVPLTAGRSLAADPTVYPPGGLVFLRIDPRGAASKGVQPEYQRLALIQDTGTAIVGARRIDVYWGTGAAAEMIAGEMRNPGEMYLLLPE